MESPSESSFAIVNNYFNKKINQSMNEKFFAIYRQSESCPGVLTTKSASHRPGEWGVLPVWALSTGGGVIGVRFISKHELTAWLLSQVEWRRTAVLLTICAVNVPKISPAANTRVCTANLCVCGLNEFTSESWGSCKTAASSKSTAFGRSPPRDFLSPSSNALGTSL